MNDKTPGICVRDLRFSYSDEQHSGKSEVLNIKSLDIPREGCHVILGPNGCGKTTLLKLIAGLMPCTEGRIELDSRAVLVHQRPYLLSGSVFHNVAYGLKIRKLPKAEIEKRVNAELENWGLTHLKDRSSLKLSGGEKQRTAIARAMVLRPDILLLDEPTSSVDPENITQMEELIDDILSGGTTVILSTHHLDFAYRMADSIVRLRRGRQVASHENVITGRVTGNQETLNVFEAEGEKLFCPGRDGAFRKAVFSENDVILSKERIQSSARNILQSTVIAIEESDADVLLRMKAGFVFKVRITRISAEELKIVPGSRLWALIKSSSIRLY